MNNLAHYLQEERRPFDESPLTDVDLMAFAALMYAEFERFPRFADEKASTPIRSLPDFGTPWEYVEHDCYPKGLLPLVEGMISNPRFCDVPLERFRCIVDEGRGLQFGAGCFPLPDGRVIVVFRGTDTKLLGWQENVEFIWRAEGPGHIEALRYFEEAACAYPDAHFVLCGHSKGGGLADHSAVYAPNELLPRIDRVVSFDGPPTFRLGEIRCPEFGNLDELLLTRYDQLPFPVQRYIFPSKVGLMLERRNPAIFTFTRTTGGKGTHNISSVLIEDGQIATRTPSAKEMHYGMILSRWVQLSNLKQRRFMGDFIIDTCRKNNTSVNLDDMQYMLMLLFRAFVSASPQDKAQFIRGFFRLCRVSAPTAPLIYGK